MVVKSSVVKIYVRPAPVYPPIEARGQFPGKKNKDRGGEMGGS